MVKSLLFFNVLVISCMLLVAQNAMCQDEDQNPSGQTQQNDDQPQNQDNGSVQEKANELKEQAEKKIDEVKEKVDNNEDAKEAADSILNPIYKLLESFSDVSYFYWIAFALMSAGVVSYALQLVLGKLFMLFKGRFSITEILSDLLGLVISVVGIGLTTQAATENSQFTESAFAVLSAAITGAIVGIIMFMWGVSLEAKAAKNR